MKYIITILYAICIIISISAQENQVNIDNANKYLIDRGEVYLQVKRPKSINIEEFSKIVSIDNMDELYIYFYVNKREFEKFLTLNIDFNVIYLPIKDSSDQLNYFKSYSGDILDKYPSYNEYIELMDSFEIKYPAICKLVEIGESVEGRRILAVKISDNVNQKEPEPEFMYSSSIHGNEVTGFMLMLKLINYLLSSYSINPKNKQLVDGVEIWINPLSNPDGTYRMSETDISTATRYNANNIDLNRNFPDPEDGTHPDGNDYQPEVFAMMDFMEGHNFVLSANLHGGAEVINYPWDTWEDRHPDDEWFQQISHEFADTSIFYSNQTYLSGFDDGIVNGYDWYSISGGRQDYVTYFLHGREVTMELSNIKIPDIADIESYWNYNYKSLLNYIKQCTYGISGVIKDSITGRPLKAKVFIQNHDDGMSYIWSDSTNGNYHRMVSQGNYDLLFQAQGYSSKLISNISVNQNKKTLLDIYLVPEYSIDTVNTITYLYDTTYSEKIIRDTIIEDSIYYDTLITNTTKNDTLYSDTTFIFHNLIDTIISNITIHDTTISEITIVNQTITQTSVYDTIIYSNSVDTSLLKWVFIDTLIIDTIYNGSIVYYITRIGKKVINPIIIDSTNTINKVDKINIFEEQEDFIFKNINNNILIDSKNKTGELVVKIYTIYGKEVFSGSYYLNNNNPLLLNLQDIKETSGIYILHLTLKNYTWAEKIYLW